MQTLQFMELPKFCTLQSYTIVQKEKLTGVNDLQYVEAWDRGREGG